MTDSESQRHRISALLHAVYLSCLLQHRSDMLEKIQFTFKQLLISVCFLWWICIALLILKMANFNFHTEECCPTRKGADVSRWISWNPSDRRAAPVVMRLTCFGFKLIFLPVTERWMRLLYSLLLLSCTGLPTRSCSPDFIIEQGSRFGNVEIEEVDLWLTGIREAAVWLVLSGGKWDSVGARLISQPPSQRLPLWFSVLLCLSW